MSQWTPEAIAALVTALAGLATAVGAVVHSRNTRKTVTDTVGTAAGDAGNQKG